MEAHRDIYRPKHQGRSVSATGLRKCKITFFTTPCLQSLHPKLLLHSPFSPLSSRDLPSHCQLHQWRCIRLLEQQLVGRGAHSVGGWRHRSPAQLQRYKQRLRPHHPGLRDEVQHHCHAFQEWMCWQRQSNANSHNRWGPKYVLVYCLNSDVGV